MREGRAPTVAEVADEALVSRATAYRYFPSAQALALEISAEQLAPTSSPDVLFDGAGDDVLERVDRVVRTFGQRMIEEEALARNITKTTIELWFEQPRDDEGRPSFPVRQGRRLFWIDEALRPLRARLSRKRVSDLRNSLAFVWGTEAVLVTRDVCELDRKHAVEAMRTAARLILVGALSEAGVGGGYARGGPC
jgi:AcrR family transcriptional regulator